MNNEAATAAPTKATLKGHGSPNRLIWFGNGRTPRAEGLTVTVERRGSKFYLLDADGDAGEYFGTAADLRIIGGPTKIWAVVL